MMKRKLGRSGIEVSAVGMGCWAIGGPTWRGEIPVGWGKIDDGASIRAIHRAIDLGVNFFDTADAYGCGHSERILGKAIKDRRSQIVVATKFGNVYDEQTRQITGASGDPDYIRSACDRSLERLDTDYIDLYQFHLADYDLDQALVVRDTLDELVAEGKIRYYGWSTDDLERARFFSEGGHCTAVQQHLNVFGGNFETLALCEQRNLASINRGPLGMGLLTGKFNHDSKLPEDDVRSRFDFRQGAEAQQIDKLDAIREILTSNGRTLAQGALAWLWGRSACTVPIPGFKTAAQVEENAGAMAFGALMPGQMAEIDRILGR